MAKVFCIANQKGGVGKSAVATLLAHYFRKLGHRVLAIDLDRRQRSLSRFFASRDATARRLGVGLPMVRLFLILATDDLWDYERCVAALHDVAG